MKTSRKMMIVAALALAVAGTLTLKNSQQSTRTQVNPPAVEATATPLPRLVDLGADKCIPCKKMAPILAELKRDYADTFTTEFIDVWKNPEAGQPYGIRLIPTQIFFDADGKELFRHEGFLGKQDILARWKELGVNCGSHQ